MHAIIAYRINDRHSRRHDIASCANIQTKQGVNAFTQEQRRLQSEFDLEMLNHVNQQQSREEVKATWDRIRGKPSKILDAQGNPIVPQHPKLPGLKIIDTGSTDGV